MTSRSFTNQEIAEILSEVAAAKEIKGDNLFAIRAYQNAADTIEHLSTPVQSLWQKEKLDTIPGVGANLASHLEELFTIGKSSHFEQEKKDLPAGLFVLLKVPGIGPKTAYKLANEFDLNDPASSLTKLKTAALNGQIANLEGFGEKSQQEILESIDKQKPKQTRIRIDIALSIAEPLIEYLSQCPDVVEISPMGSLRRGNITVGDIDIGVATHHSDRVIEYLKQYRHVGDIQAEGEDLVRLILGNHMQVDIKFVSPDAWGSLLQHFSGSKAHNVTLREFAIKKDLSLSEYGIKTNGHTKTFTKEADFYHALGLDWIPPEIREDNGEIEASKNHRLPHLITIKDIQGEFHTHTNHDWISSHDSADYSISDLIHNAIDRNYKYIGIGDHNPSLKSYSAEELLKEVRTRSEKIKQTATKYPNIHALATLEVDIRSDGQLAIPVSAANYLDYIVASVHSSFHQPKDQITNRVIKAIQYPKVKILGHPTGRIIGNRDGYVLDWEKIFKACSEFQVALEINSHPARLDIDDQLTKMAIEAGVKIVIDSDSHTLTDLDNIKYGVIVARRGWATKADVVNTWEWKKVREWMGIREK